MLFVSINPSVLPPPVPIKTWLAERSTLSGDTDAVYKHLLLTELLAILVSYTLYGPNTNLSLSLPYN